LVREIEQGAYLGPGPELEAAAVPVAATPHFDVFDWGCRRLILGKCPPLPDDDFQRFLKFGAAAARQRLDIPALRRVKSPPLRCLNN